MSRKGVIFPPTEELEKQFKVALTKAAEVILEESRKINPNIRKREKTMWKLKADSVSQEIINEKALDEAGFWVINSGRLIGMICLSSYNHQTGKKNRLVQVSGIGFGETLDSRDRMLKRLPKGTQLVFTQE